MSSQRYTSEFKDEAEKQVLGLAGLGYRRKRVKVA